MIHPVTVLEAMPGQEPGAVDALFVANTLRHALGNVTGKTTVFCPLLSDNDVIPHWKIIPFGNVTYPFTDLMELN